MTRQEILPRSGLEPAPRSTQSWSCGKLLSRNWQEMAEEVARVGESSPNGDDDNVVVVVLGLGRENTRRRLMKTRRRAKIGECR